MQNGAHHVSQPASPLAIAVDEYLLQSEAHLSEPAASRAIRRRKLDSAADMAGGGRYLPRLGGEQAGDGPCWERLNEVALMAHERVTGDDEGLFAALTARGHRSPSDAKYREGRRKFASPRLKRLFPRTDEDLPGRIPKSIEDE